MKKDINVVYAEDDELTASVMLYKMKKAGFKVRHFPSGEGVMESIIKEKPDVILLDLMMPKKSGYGILKEIKNHPEAADTPVIIFSAIDHTQEYKSLSFKFADYILKPCNPDVLIPRILNVCSEAFEDQNVS